MSSRITPRPRPTHSSDRGRRVLLAAVTALIAARPLVAADDPGRVPMSTATGHLYLTAGWFIVLAGWAVWNAWAKPGRRVIGLVELGLIVTAGLVAARAAWAPDRWLAWRVAWDWVAVAAAFVVVRSLTTYHEDARGLFAVILATGVAALSAHIPARVAMMSGWSWPAAQEAVGDPDSPFAVESPLDSTIDGIQSRAAAHFGWLVLAVPAVTALAIVALLPGRGPRSAGVVPILLLFAGVAAFASGDPALPTPPTQPALDMIRDAPGVGVGPGHYGQFVARHWQPDLAHLLTNPPGSYLGLAATSGLPAAVAVLASLLTLFVIVAHNRPAWAQARPVGPGLPTAGPRWDVYAGGVVGLLAGLVLQVGDLPPASAPAICGLAVEAAVRAVVWFVMIACLEKAAWPGRILTAAAFSGVLFVTVAGGLIDVLSPATAGIPAWILAAVARNLAAPPPVSLRIHGLIGRFVPLFVAVSLSVAFIMLTAIPGIVAANHVWHARLAARAYPAKLKDVVHADPLLKKRFRADSREFIDQAILRPLALAVRADPADAGPLLEQVPWWLAKWELGGARSANRNALKVAVLAQDRDPEGLGGYLAELHVCLRLAELSSRRDEQFQEAERQIAEIVRRDPARAARLRFQVARVYFAIKDREKGKVAAEAAKRLDADAPGPRYRLTDDERAQVQKWLEGGGGKAAR